MRTRFSRFLLMCVTLYASVLARGFAQEGAIQGNVRDDKGKPVYRAQVSAYPVGNILVLSIRHAETDESGRFTIDHLDWGRYRLYAMKEDENYPDTMWALYSPTLPPILVLSPDSPTVTRSLVLGPKAGKLHIVSVTDAITGKNLATLSGITLERTDGPNTFLGVSTSVEYALVPSSTDVSVKVESDGYAPWPPANEPALGQIRLAPEEVFELKVQMQPLSGLSAEIARMVKRAAYGNLVISSKGKRTGPSLPQAEDVQRLRELGDQGINALADYVQPKQDGIDPNHQIGAVLLLAQLATDPSLDLIGRFAVEAQDPAVRSNALKPLATNQRPKDILLLQQISKSDPDLSVRADAAKLLQNTQQK
jgi:hypothetical protein